MNRERLKAAYERLGVTPEDVAKLPVIRDELARWCERIEEITGRRTEVWYYVSLSDAPEARAVLCLYYETPPRERQLLPLEAFCLAAKVPPLTFLDHVALAMSRSNTRASAVIASSVHPAILDATIDIALKPGHPMHRLAAQGMLHRAVGFLPQPRGAQTTVNVVQQATASAPAGVFAAPAPEATIRRLAERLNARRLPAERAPEKILDAPAAPSPVEEPFGLLEDAVEADDEE